MDAIKNDNETVSLKGIIINYVRHWKLFVVMAFISLIPAVLYLIFYPKTYEVMSRLRLQEDKEIGGGGVGLGEAAGLMKSFGLGGGSVSAINVEDEMATLASNDLLKKVILKLGLNVKYEEPFSLVKLYEDSPLLVVPDSATQQTLDRGFNFKVKAAGNGAIRIKEKKSGKEFSFSSLPAQVVMEQGVFNFSYRTPEDARRPFSLKVSVSPASWAAEDFAELIEVEEYSKNANTLEFVYTDHEKKRGVDLLNLLMKEYNENAGKIKKEDGEKVMIFLEGRIQGVMAELATIERQIESYKIRNKMTDIEHDVEFYVEAVKNLREKIIELEAQQHIIRLLDAYVKDPKNRYNLIPAMLSTGESEKGGAITTYNEALIERERLVKSSKTDNPLLEVATSQVDKLRESVFLAIDNANKSVEYILSDLKGQEQAIYAKMGNVPTYEREYLDYRRQQEILQGVYLILLQKKEEIALSLGQKRDKGYILDAAFVKQRPVAPRKLYAGIFMILFTIIIPVVYLFGKEQFESLVEEYKKSNRK